MFQAGGIARLLSIAAAAAVFAGCSRQPPKSSHERTIVAAPDGDAADIERSLEGDEGTANTRDEGGAYINVDDVGTADPIADAASEEIADLLREKVLVVTVHPDGGYSVDGKRLSLESLSRLLRERAESSPRGEDNLPTVEVRILAHSDCEYALIQRVMVACMRAYIWKISFGAIKEEGGEDGTEE